MFYHAATKVNAEFSCGRGLAFLKRLASAPPIKISQDAIGKIGHTMR
jgi:hypothetical protein